MRYGISSLITGLALFDAALAAPTSETLGPKDKRSYVIENGVNRTIFEHAATGGKLDYVTNSGICETTSGVNQYSGYYSVGTGMHMWFVSNPSTS